MNKRFEKNVNSYCNGPDEINSASKNLTKIKVSLDFSKFLTSKTEIQGSPDHMFSIKKNLGALIGAGALNRINTVRILSQIYH